MTSLSLDDWGASELEQWGPSALEAWCERRGPGAIDVMAGLASVRGLLSGSTPGERRRDARRFFEAWVARPGVGAGSVAQARTDYATAFTSTLAQLLDAHPDAPTVKLDDGTVVVRLEDLPEELLAQLHDWMRCELAALSAVEWQQAAVLLALQRFRVEVAEAPRVAVDVLEPPPERDPAHSSTAPRAPSLVAQPR